MDAGKLTAHAFDSDRMSMISSNKPQSTLRALLARNKTYIIYSPPAPHIAIPTPAASTSAASSFVLAPPSLEARAALVLPLADGADALADAPDDGTDDRETDELDTPDETDVGTAEDPGKESVTLVLARVQNRCASCSADCTSLAQFATAHAYIEFANSVRFLGNVQVP